MDSAPPGEAVVPPANDRRRAFPRERVLMHGTVRANASPPLGFRIRNLSAGGLLGEMANNLRRDESVTVRIGNAPDIEAHVMWSMPDRFGIAFDWPIDLRQLRANMGPAPVTAVLFRYRVDGRRPGLHTR